MRFEIDERELSLAPRMFPHLHRVNLYLVVTCRDGLGEDTRTSAGTVCMMNLELCNVPAVFRTFFYFVFTPPSPEGPERGFGLSFSFRSRGLGPDPGGVT